MNVSRASHRQKGFLIIAAVFLVVVLAGLVVYLATVSTTSQTASAADLNSSRAYQAARAGAEWAMYLVRPLAGASALKTACEAGSTTQTLAPGSTLSAFTVTVTCSSADYTEGATAMKVYSIVSNACNVPTGGGVCPNAATVSSTYVDREVSVTVTNEN